MHLFSDECREYKTISTFHARSRRWTCPTFYREFGNIFLGRVDRGYNFVEELHNYKTGAVWPLENWDERTSFKQGWMVHQGEGRGKFSSPHSVKDFGNQKTPKMGRYDPD